MEKIVIPYLLVMNLVGFILMGADKKRARTGSYRIPEKVLFGVALLGGCFGTTIGMKVFRHKTRHWYFVLGFLCISLLWGYCILKIFFI